MDLFIAMFFIALCFYFLFTMLTFLGDVKSKLTGTNRLDKFNHEISSPEQYLECMDSIRESCNLLALVPVYFFTSPFLSSYILSGGFRLSSDDDLSGVIFTTKGPASFGLGSERYEKNLIVALKGASRINDYRGKHKLDVCIVYAVEPRVLQPVRGESEHFRQIPRVFFEAFSDLKDDEETFFLRPDRIMASFLLDPYTLQVDDSVEKAIKEEARRDKESLEMICQIGKTHFEDKKHYTDESCDASSVDDLDDVESGFSSRLIRPTDSIEQFDDKDEEFFEGFNDDIETSVDCDADESWWLCNRDGYIEDKSLPRLPSSPFFSRFIENGPLPRSSSLPSSFSDI